MDNPYQPPAGIDPPPLPRPGSGPLRVPRGLAVASAVLYGLCTAAVLADHAMRSMVPGSTAALHDSHAVTVGLVPLDLVILSTFLAAAVLFLMWKYRAAANAAILDPAGMKYSPAMCAGSYFIPFANLVIPCWAMADISRVSTGDRRGVALWWTTQVLSFFLGGAAALRAGESPVPGWLEHAVVAWDTAAFFIAWRLVMRITRGQESRAAA